MSKETKLMSKLPSRCKKRMRVLKRQKNPLKQVKGSKIKNTQLHINI